MSEKQLHVGWASVSITPDEPVQLMGQHHERVSTSVRDPVTATALALETRDDDARGDQAILVSCDLVAMPRDLVDKVREAVESRLCGFDVRRLTLSATHTHTAPVMMPGWYRRPAAGVMDPSQYADFFVKRVSEAVIEAWECRRPGAVSRALGHAAVGYNRRMAYEDGTAKMYGSSDTPGFLNVEGSQDHGVELLFCSDLEGNLTGVVVNIACPSQVVESEYYVSADFWSAVRRRLRERYSEGLNVLPLTGAAGDQSPRDLVRRGRGEPNMRHESGLEEMGARIANAVDYAFRTARSEAGTRVVFEHVVEDIALPGRKVTQQEAEEAGREAEELMRQDPPDDSTNAMLLQRARRLGERYERQGTDPVFQVELHVMRLGDIAIATNPFELFLDYGLRIKARSKALQTFIVQLCCGAGGYLPTTKAVGGGGYGAAAPDGYVGPEGGQALVNRTVELINGMWRNGGQ